MAVKGRPKKVKSSTAVKAIEPAETSAIEEKFADDPTTEVIKKTPRFGFSEQKLVGQEKPARDYPLSKAERLAAETAGNAKEE